MTLQIRVDENKWSVYGAAETTRWYETAEIDIRIGCNHVKKFDLAIDVGANIGIYTHILARKFTKVVAFEPFPPNIKCFIANQARKFPNTNVVLHEVALGDKETRRGMADVDGISAHLKPGDSVGVEMLDSFGLEPDFIKIDAEGYDVKVLRGALETIKRSWPVLLVENKVVPDRHDEWYRNEEAREVLDPLGYKVISRSRGIDWLWVKQ